MCTRSQGDEGEPRAVRVELSSENDLFFHFAHTLNEASYAAVQEEQKLMIDFPQYAAVLIKMLNNCIKEPERCVGGGVRVRVRMCCKFVLCKCVVCVWTRMRCARQWLAVAWLGAA